MNEETIIVEDTVEDISQDTPTEYTEAATEKASENTEIDDEDQDTIALLQNTIVSLKDKISELELARDSQEKMLGQLSDFAELFPSVEIKSIPESVWDSVRSGTSLAAAYALYEKRVAAENMRIEKINSLNSLKSAGAAGKNTASEFFTPDDVRKMSPAEVRANFSKIKKSMTKWN